MQVLLMCIYDV